MNGGRSNYQCSNESREIVINSIPKLYNCGRILRESDSLDSTIIFIRSRQQRFRCRRGNIPEIGPTKKLPPKWYLFKEGESALAKLETWLKFSSFDPFQRFILRQTLPLFWALVARDPGINFAISIGIDPHFDCRTIARFRKVGQINW